MTTIVRSAPLFSVVGLLNYCPDHDRLYDGRGLCFQCEEEDAQ